MHVRERIERTLVLGLLLPALGCALIVSGQSATVKIDSYPPNANVVIRDKHGAEVTTTMTPAVVSLKRGDRWFLPARYTATVSSPGYESAEIPIRSTVNPWMLGNIVLGGIPGLVVDGATGALWKPKEEMYAQHLKPLDETLYPSPHTLGQAATPAPLWPVPAQPDMQYPVVPTAFFPAVRTTQAGANPPAPFFPLEQAALPPAVETTRTPLGQNVTADAF